MNPIVFEVFLSCAAFSLLTSFNRALFVFVSTLVSKCRLLIDVLKLHIESDVDFRLVTEKNRVSAQTDMIGNHGVEKKVWIQVLNQIQR